MEIAKFTEAVLNKVGVLDVNEAPDGEDGDTVLEALRIVYWDLRGRDLLQTVLDESDIDDRLAKSLIVLVAFEVAPGYGYSISDEDRRMAESRIGDIARTPFRSRPLAKSTFLGTANTR